MGRAGQVIRANPGLSEGFRVTDRGLDSMGEAEIEIS